MRKVLVSPGLLMFVSGLLVSLGLIQIPGLVMFPNKPTLQFWIYHADPSTGKGVKLPDGRELHGYGIENVRIEVYDTADTPPVVWDNEQKKTVQRFWDYTGTYGLSFFAMAFDSQCDRTWSWRVIYGGKELQGKVYVPNKEVWIWICVDVDSGKATISPAEYNPEAAASTSQPSETTTQTTTQTAPEESTEQTQPQSPIPPLTKSQMVGIPISACGTALTILGLRRRK